MSLKGIVGGTCLALLAVVLAAPARAQGERGKAEMKAGPGVITVDYGRPSLKGRDMFAQLQEGTFWRVGRNEATVLTTPVDLAFGGTRVAKGAYSLWLKKSGESFLLVFNSQTGQWGTQHDPGQGRRQRDDDEVAPPRARRDVHHRPHPGAQGRRPGPELGPHEAGGALRDPEVGEGWTSCDASALPPFSPSLLPRSPRTPPALRGIETGDLDRSVAPCTDFHEFANGAWRAANPIPPSMVRWSRRWAAGEAAKDQLNAILDEVSAPTKWPKGSVEQLIGDHYASCMDEARVEALGLEPIRPLLAEIDGVTDIAGVQKMIGRFHELAIPVPFGLTASPDSHAADPGRSPTSTPRASGCPIATTT